MSEATVIDVEVRGLHCAGCVARLARVLEQVPGVLRAQVSLLGQSARVEVAPGASVARADVAKVIEDAGFYPL